MMVNIEQVKIELSDFLYGLMEGPCEYCIYNDKDSTICQHYDKYHYCIFEANDKCLDMIINMVKPF